MFAAGWPLRDHFFVIPGIVSLMTYLVVLWVSKALEPDERQHLRRTLTSVRSRLPIGNKPSTSARGGS